MCLNVLWLSVTNLASFTCMYTIVETTGLVTTNAAQDGVPIKL